jgi:hypothetical protein
MRLSSRTMGNLVDQDKCHCRSGGRPDYQGSKIGMTLDTLMSAIRMQTSVDSGKAILRFRNGLDRPATLVLLLCSLEGTGDEWSPLLDPISLGPGEIRSADISPSLRKLFSGAETTDPHEVRIRIRMLSLPTQYDSPKEVECTATFSLNRFTQFTCH